MRMLVILRTPWAKLQNVITSSYGIQIIHFLVRWNPAEWVHQLVGEFKAPRKRQPLACGTWSWRHWPARAGGCRDRSPRLRRPRPAAFCASASGTPTCGTPARPGAPAAGPPRSPRTRWWSSASCLDAAMPTVLSSHCCHPCELCELPYWWPSQSLALPAPSE